MWVLSIQFWTISGLVQCNVCLKKKAWSDHQWEKLVDSSQDSNMMENMHGLHEVEWSHKKGSLPVSFIDQMLDRLAGQEHYYFRMAIQDTTKLWMHQRTSRNPFSLCRTVHMLSREFHLGYAMPRPPSKDDDGCFSWYGWIFCWDIHWWFLDIRGELG